MKVFYTATAHATGDGRNGHATTDDGQVDVDLRLPTELGGPGGATNPEQLFAMGFAACFHSSLKTVAGKDTGSVEGSEVSASVGIGGLDGGGFGLTVELDVVLPNLEGEAAESLVARRMRSAPTPTRPAATSRWPSPWCDAEAEVARPVRSRRPTGQTPTVPTRTHRNLPLVIGCGFFGGAFVVLFLLLVFVDAGGSPSGGSATELYVISLLVGLALLRATRLRVRVDESGITACTLVRTHRLPWDELVGALADRRGLVLLPATGNAVMVQSLGQTTVARWLRSGLSGEEVAADINEELAHRSS